jgi:hypothetical protein
MTFNDNMKALTQDYLAPKVVDAILSGNVLAMKLLGNSQRFPSRSMKKGVIVEKQTNGGSFSGLDTFNTNKSNTKISIEFDPRAYSMPVVIEGIERDVNASDKNASANLVKEAMEEAQNSMLDDLGDMFYSDGTGNSSKDFLGLAAIVDDGGVAASYGGQLRSTYTVLQSYEETVTGALTSLVPLRTAEMRAKKGADKVNLHVTSETKWNEFEGLLQATVHFNVDATGYKQVTRDRIVSSKEALGAEAGFDALYYRGAPVVADEKCPDLKWYGLNMDHLAFYGIKSTKYKEVSFGNSTQIEGAYSKGVPMVKGMHFSGLMDSINQYAEIGHFLLLGQLISFNPNRHFKMTFSA